LCSQKLNYADYIENCIAGKERSVTYKPRRGDEFLLSSSDEQIALSFEARQFLKLPSELIFAQCILKKMCLSSLVFGILCINKRVTNVTNELLMSKHVCVFVRFTSNLKLPKNLAGLTYCTPYCSMYCKKPDPSTRYTVRRNLIICFESLGVIVNYV